MHQRFVTSLVASALLSATTACSVDVGPEAGVAIDDITATSQASYRITLRNTGDFPGTLVGCGEAPVTFVQMWTGSDWVDSETQNDDCLPQSDWERTLQPGAEFVYEVTVAKGRFRFAVTMLSDDEIVETGWSDAVGIGT